MTLDSPIYRKAAYGLVALVTIGALFLLIQGRFIDATILAGFVIGAVALGRWRSGVPSLFTLLFGIVASINAAGYVLDLWHAVWWFDIVVHTVTPFAIVGAVGWILIERETADGRENGFAYFAKVLFIGLLIGLAWEGFEYVVGMIGAKRDTLIDLAADSVGAMLAALFCLWAARSPRQGAR